MDDEFHDTRSRFSLSPRSSFERFNKSIYVYDYSKDKLSRIKDGDEFKNQRGVYADLERIYDNWRH